MKKHLLSSLKTPILMLLSLPLLLSCVKQTSYVKTYVTFPDELLVDCNLYQAEGVEYRDLLQWGLNNAESIKKCNANAETLRDLNELYKEKNNER